MQYDVSVQISRLVSVFFSADLILRDQFLIGIYTLMCIKETINYKKSIGRNKQITKNIGRIYSVLKFTVFYHVIVLMLAVLQWC
jgi:hypothetical protein